LGDFDGFQENELKIGDFERAFKLKHLGIRDL